MEVWTIILQLLMGILACDGGAFRTEYGYDCYYEDLEPLFVSSEAKIFACKNYNTYMRGIVRLPPNDTTHTHDPLSRLNQFRCCPKKEEWWFDDDHVTHTDFDHFHLANMWARCPPGFFLQGLWIDPDNSSIGGILAGRCSRPASHPRKYRICYDQDVGNCFNGGTRGSECRCQQGYFLTGLYHGTGGNRLMDLDKFRCCEMELAPAELETVEMAKERFRDITLVRLATLAKYLGFEYTYGCRGQGKTGQDFIETSLGWEADKSKRCHGEKKDDRLKINYKGWKILYKGIAYGDSTTRAIKPEYSLQKFIINHGNTSVDEDIKYEVTSTRVLTHTKSSSWKKSHMGGFSLSVSAPLDIFSLSGSANFTKDEAGSESDSFVDQDEKKFFVYCSKTMLPRTAAKAMLTLNQANKTTPYNATFTLKFTAELQGHLKWGGGYNASDTNYHYKYRGDKERPQFRHSFGDDSYHFWEDLRRQYKYSLRPWMWRHADDAWGEKLKEVVDSLVDETQYEFNISGTFMDIFGTHVDLRIEGIPYLGSPHSIVGGCKDGKPNSNTTS